MYTPNYQELLGILVLGVLQPITEIVFGQPVASIYNLVAVVLVLTYVLYRLRKTPGLLKAWGIRFDTISTTLPAYLFFTVIAGGLVYWYGTYADRTPLPASFWYVFALYPVWGIGQQFALQNFVARNLEGLFSNIIIRALITTAIFSLSHTPSIELMLLSGMAGFCFTILYHYAPNLLLLGCAHGILGALIFYLILGKDQWAIIQMNLPLIGF